MNHETKQRTPFGMRFALASLGMLAGLALLQPAETQAAVSGGATIFNEATVTYSTPTIPSTTAKGSTTVLVATKASSPFVTVTPTAQTTGENTTVNYTYNIINQSNGTNNLTITNPLTSTDNLVNAPSVNSLASYTFNNLWGGISLAIPADNTVTVPAGTLAGLANGTTVGVKNGLNVYYYTVAGTTTGTLPSSGIAEIPATLTLTPLAYAGVPATNLTAAIAGGSAGIIIGQYASVVHTLTTTTTTTAANGTHAINITAVATDAAAATASYTTSAGDLNQTVTTVTKNPLSVVKTAAPLGAKKPGDTITYTVVVTNNTSAATTAAQMADPLSPYITYTANTTTLNGIAFGQPDGGVFPFAANTSINSLGQAAGVINPGASATIVYQVTVN